MKKKEFEATWIKPVIYLNDPLPLEKDELLGYSSQVDELCSVIADSKAQFIGISGAHGIGKSTLIRCLTERLNTTFDAKIDSIDGAQSNQLGKTKYVEINLWDSSDCSRDESLHPISKVTKSFLFQLALGLQEPKKKRKVGTKGSDFASTINKLISKNYGMLSASLVGINKLKFYLILFLITVCYIFLRIKMPFVIASILNDVPDIATNIIDAVETTFSALFIVSIVLLLSYSRLKIAFSSWKSEGKRNPEIGDIYEILEVIAEEIECQTKKVKLSHASSVPGYLLIAFEDFDRIEDASVAVQLLKDLRGYINFFKTRGLDNIIFILSTRPIHDFSQESAVNYPSLDTGLGHDSKQSGNGQWRNIYSKIFDYCLELAPVHHEDCEVILKALLEEKNEDIFSLTEKKTSDLLAQLKWIIKGEELNVRRIKERLNLCFSIYRNLCLRDNTRDFDIKLSSCAAVAYLRESYPLEFARLERFEVGISQFMKDAQRRMAFKRSNSIVELNDNFINTYTSDLNIGNPENFTNMLNEIAVMIKSRVIDTDSFRMYFFTYPKNSRIYTKRQRVIKDLLFHDNSMDSFKTNRSEITQICQSEKKFVTRCIEDIAGFDSAFPQGVLMSFALMSIIIAKNYREQLLSTMLNTFPWVQHPPIFSAQDYRYFIRLAKYLKVDILSDYFRGLLLPLRDLSDSDIRRIRKDVLNLSADLCNQYSILYSDSTMPLALEDELNEIKNVEQFIDCVPNERIDASNGIYVARSVIRLYTFAQKDELTRLISSCYTACNANEEISLLYLLYLKKAREVDAQKISNIFQFALNKNELIHDYINSLESKKIPKEYYPILTDYNIFNGIKGSIRENALRNDEIYYYLMTCNRSTGANYRIDKRALTSSHFMEAISKIHENDRNQFYKIRSAINERDIRKFGLENLFFDKFPTIKQDEIIRFKNLSILLSCIDVKHFDASDIEILAQHINKIGVRDSAYLQILEFLTKWIALDRVDGGKKVYSLLDLSIYDIEKVNEKQKENCYRAIKPIIDIGKPLELIAHIAKTNYLEPFLFEELIDYFELEATTNPDKVTEEERIFVEAVSKMDYNRIPDITIPYIVEVIEHIDFETPLWAELDDYLFKNNQFEPYYISRALRCGPSSIKKDDVNKHFDILENIYSTRQKVASVLSDNLTFLNEMANKKGYKDLPFELMMPLAKLDQSATLLLHVIRNSTYTSKEKIEYIEETSKPIPTKRQVDLYNMIKAIPDEEIMQVVEVSEAVRFIFDGKIRRNFDSWVKRHEV